MTEVLDVWLSDVKVGQIVRTPGEYNAFSLDESYRQLTDRPTLSLSLLSPEFTLRKDPKPTNRVLPAFFSNLLPEGKLRSAMEQYHAKSVRPSHDFDLLGALGGDLPGAVRALPSEGAFAPMPASQTDKGARFSLAGVQMKLSVLKDTGKKGGLTLAVGNEKDGQYIAKFPSLSQIGLSENEFAMLALCEAIGMDVPQRELVDKTQFEGVPTEFNVASTGKVLLVRRFDRENGRRIHMEDFCQIFGQPASRKYDAASSHDIAKVISRTVSLDAAIESVRRLALSALIGNGDMHLKNWTLIYPGDGITPAVAPVYDMLSTIAYLPGDDMALSLGGAKVFKALTPDRWETFASRAALPVGAVKDAVSDVVAQVNDKWLSLPEREVVPTSILSMVDDHVAAMSLILDPTFSNTAKMRL